MADGFYILRKSPRGSNPHLEDHGQPRNRRWNAKRLDDRSVDEFLGVCRGLVGDGTLSEEEILFLQTWLNTRTYLRIVGRIMAVAGSLTTEHTMRNVERSGRGKFNLPEEQCLTLALTCCTRVICGAGRQGGTVAERYQGGVAHRSAEAAASWWAPAVRRCGQRS